MFMNTIAVGPLALIEFCVTGGTTDAIPARGAPCLSELKLPAVRVRLLANARPVSFVTGRPRDMVMRMELQFVIEAWCAMQTSRNRKCEYDLTFGLAPLK